MSRSPRAVHEHGEEEEESEEEGRGEHAVPCPDLAERAEEANGQGRGRGRIPDPLDQPDVFGIPGVGSDIEDEGNESLQFHVQGCRWALGRMVGHVLRGSQGCCAKRPVGRLA